MMTAPLSPSEGSDPPPMRGMGIRAHLFSLVLLATVPMAALVVYDALEAREAAAKEATIRLKSVAKAAAEELESRIAGARLLLSALAEAPSVRLAVQPACARLLGDVVQRAPRHIGLSLTVAAHDGSVVCSGTPLVGPVNLADRDYFKEAHATRNASVGRPVVSRISNTVRLPVAHPILDPAGEVERLVTASISLERLAEQFMASPVLAGAVFTVWDERGTVLFRHPDNERWIGTLYPDAGIVTALAVSKGTRTVEAPGLDGVRRVYVLAGLDDFPQLGLTITAGISKETLNAEADRALRNDLALLALILAAALASASAFGEIAIRRRVAAVTQAASRITGGALETRIGGPYRGGELGQLARAFDEMAVAMQRQIEDIRRAEQKIRAQLDHLNLLDQITRSTGERLDLKSIFQIVLIRLEDSLPIDFGCVCLYDAAANTLRVTCVGAKSEALARELMMDERATIDIDQNGLSRCVQGQLVYEPDVSQVRFAFPERLARGGLGSLVMAPLRSESRVFGVLVVARRAAQAFSSAECEFLRQLSEHVALAAHQAQLYGALQQAYDDLRQTQQAMMQEERLRALGQMASGIAHDINNALSPVSLYVESMLETERDLSARARGYLETIQRAVGDVAQTVARMREFYRKREAQLELTPVQLNSLVQQVLDLTRARWSDMPQSRGIVIRALTELAPDLPNVMGVESEIREALTNLVFNAVDAMPEGGTLTLRTRLAHADPEHPAVAVEVADTGVGMDDDMRRRCLEPFFTTKGERGTGLGLAMVFGMVQRHSAEVEIDSAPGAGTTMRLLFAVPTAVETEPGQPARALEVPSRLRLLLIDDDPILLKALQDALETDGHVIVTANGGEAGISTFRTALGRGETFAAVITDLGMPYVDGRQVAVAVKEASPATPVILLTGWGQRLVADNDIPLNVDRVLAKPPKLRELREALAQLCPGPQRPETSA